MQARAATQVAEARGTLEAGRAEVKAYVLALERAHAARLAEAEAAVAHARAEAAAEVRAALSVGIG